MIAVQSESGMAYIAGMMQPMKLKVHISWGPQPKSVGIMKEGGPAVDEGCADDDAALTGSVLRLGFQRDLERRRPC